MFKNRRTRKHGLPAEATVLSIEIKRRQAERWRPTSPGS
jgi:hypothetical protein